MMSEWKCHSLKPPLHEKPMQMCSTTSSPGLETKLMLSTRTAPWVYKTPITRLHHELPILPLCPEQLLLADPIWKHKVNRTEQQVTHAHAVTGPRQCSFSALTQHSKDKLAQDTKELARFRGSQLIKDCWRFSKLIRLKKSQD